MESFFQELSLQSPGLWIFWDQMGFLTLEMMYWFQKRELPAFDGWWGQLMCREVIAEAQGKVKSAYSRFFFLKTVWKYFDWADIYHEKVPTSCIIIGYKTKWGSLKAEHRHSTSPIRNAPTFSISWHIAEVQPWRQHTHTHTTWQICLNHLPSLLFPSLSDSWPEMTISKPEY